MSDPLFTLLPQVVDACPDMLVVAAGGIADGRGMAAALMLGAQGVLMGTRFPRSRPRGEHRGERHGYESGRHTALVTDRRRDTASALNECNPRSSS
jgi:hypothetical protein